MNRKILAVLGACLAFALVSSSCGSDSDDGASSSAAATTAAPAPSAAAVADSGSDGLAGTSGTVFGPESSDEEAGALQDALDALAAESGIEITYTGNRDAADMINTQVAGGNPPDIFVFPQPGKLADFARDGAVLPLPADVASSMEWSDAWTSFGNVDGTQYGVPTKSDLKSLVWYKPAKFAEKGYEIPGTWDALKSLAGDMIANGDTPFCVGIESGPATGWTFTDWVEDLMLRMHGADLYDEWVAGTLPFSSPEVSGVFEEVLELWNTPGMVYASGGSIAATPFGDNGQPLVDDDCMMHRQASFYAAFIPEGTAFADGSADAVDTFYFPSVKGDYPVLGAGTLVGAFRDAPEVWEVMKYFGSASYAETRQVAQTDRKGGGLSGFLSGASGQDPSVYQPLEQSFLNILVSADVVRFDASDLMPAAVGAGTFWTDGTAVVNGDKTVAEATADIDASWPGAAPAEAAPLAPPEVTDIRICTAPTYTGLPVFVAGDMGVFESFGFTSHEYVTCASGPANAAALVAGEVDFVANTPDNMLGLRDSGFDVIMFSQAIDGHFFDVLVSSDQEVVEGDWEATMQALEGTNVGVVARGAAAEQMARELYEQAGVDPESSTYIATGLGAPTVAAMDSGEIDWAITFEPGMTMGVVNGIGTRPFSLVAGDGPSTLDWPSLVNTTSREFAAANPNTVAAYTAALEAASAWIMDDANIDGVLEVMANNVGLVGADMAADVHAANKQYFSVDSTLDPDRLMNNVTYAVGRGIISESMNFADFAITNAGVPPKLVTALAAACPSPLVIQTDWFPEAEHGALYEMIGAGYSIDADNMVVTGPGQLGGAPLGIDIEVRTGGPAIGWSPVASYMYTDDSIHIGYANTEAQAQLADTPLISVMAPLEKNPQMIMWDPNTYPDVENIADLGEQGITINVFAGGVFIEVWIAEGVVSADQIDPSYDGGPAMFIAADGAIAQQGFASSEPYQYSNDFADWGKEVAYELLHDTGFEVYSQTLGVRPDDMEDMRACLELFIPVVQQSV
ncbi:MAG: extracellular solute-binding protein, partial [Acidimicrobiales bacterium]|nr:extracellular solute-binding protein [Acidimicrobiales bacterium]